MDIVGNRLLSIDELMDVALRTKIAQDYHLNVDLDSLDVDDVAPPTVKPLLSSFLLPPSQNHSLYT